MFFGILDKGVVGIEQETIFLNSQMVALSVLVTSPMVVILNFLAGVLYGSTIHGGVDEIIIDVEQIKENDDGDGNEMQCAVCLCEVSRGEKYRVVPKCKHGYHVSCIDSWLQTNPSSPRDLDSKFLYHFKILDNFQFEGLKQMK
ncbi:hypothetical protein LIER_11418 [Lithospermum erythrorhizon]|uniref:RING-type domain-containing protein n=1 Tax=Lithospermum erythrorhizon TaxID=34254 RepID=A0AAV3PN12_LITER